MPNIQQCSLSMSISLENVCPDQNVGDTTLLSFINTLQPLLCSSVMADANIICIARNSMAVTLTVMVQFENALGYNGSPERELYRFVVWQNC